MSLQNIQLKPRYVLPRSQMIINTLLAESESSQINFRHEEYAIQIKHHNHMTITFFDRELQDVEWSIEFLGVKLLQHVAVSFPTKKRKMRIIFYQNKSIHFIEANIRQKNIECDEIIPLSLENEDQLLLISQDLFPEGSTGVYLLSTRLHQYLVFKVNKNRYQIINLNPTPRLNKMMASLGQFFKPSQITMQQSEEQITRNLLLKHQQSKEQFKAIILKGFRLEIRFISCPAIEQKMCQPHANIIHQIKLNRMISDHLKIQENTNILLKEAKLFSLNDNEVAIIVLIQSKSRSRLIWIVSLVLNLQKKQIDSIHNLLLNSNEANQISYELIPGSEEMIVSEKIKGNNSQQILLKHVTLKDLQMNNEMSYNSDGRYFLTQSRWSSEQNDQNSKVVLLTSFKVFQISILQNPKNQNIQKYPISSEYKFDRQTAVKSYRQTIKFNINRLSNTLLSNPVDAFNFFEALSHDFGNNIPIESMRKSSEKQIEQVLKISSSLTFTCIFIKNGVFNKKEVEGSHEDTFHKLLAGDTFNKIENILTEEVIKKDKWLEFIQIWTQFLRQHRQRKQFKDNKLRQIQSKILKSHFEWFINNFFLTLLHSNFYLLVQLQRKKTMNTIIDFLKQSSGIFRLQKTIYRMVIDNSQQLPTLKDLALNFENEELLTVLYFENEEISPQQMQQYLEKIKNSYDQETQNEIIQKFMDQYIERARSSALKTNQIIPSLFIFNNHEKKVRQSLGIKNSNLEILYGLKLGQRQQLKQRILDIANRVKRDSNKQVTISLTKKLELIYLDSEEMRE